MTSSNNCREWDLGNAWLQPGNEPEQPAAYWHHRNYLPHFESAEKVQHITIHLSDSLRLFPNP